jgi:hypothetical protein
VPVPEDLADWLATSDLQALDCHAQWRALPGVADDARYQRLHQAMDALDFPAALSEVRHLLVS